MPREDFDRVSNMMATYYPSLIRIWYMSKGRMITQSTMPSQALKAWPWVRICAAEGNIDLTPDADVVGRALALGLNMSRLSVANN